MASQLNGVMLEGHLLTAPVLTENDGEKPYCSASLCNREEWINPADGSARKRENMIGIIAHGETAKKLAKLQAGAHLTFLGKLQTTESDVVGPRGGKSTKTKVRVTQILFLL